MDSSGESDTVDDWETLADDDSLTPDNSLPDGFAGPSSDKV